MTPEATLVVELFRSIPHALQTTHKDNMDTLRHLVSVAFGEEQVQWPNPDLEPVVNLITSLRNRAGARTNALTHTQRSQLRICSELLEEHATNWVQKSKEDTLVQV